MFKITIIHTTPDRRYHCCTFTHTQQCNNTLQIHRCYTCWNTLFYQVFTLIERWSYVLWRYFFRDTWFELSNFEYTNFKLGAVTLSGYKFCGASVTEIGRLSGVTSNLQTQCDNAIKKSDSTPTEIAYLSGVPWSVQTQVNSCLRENSMTTLSGNIGLSNSGNNHYSLLQVQHLQK